MEQKAADSLGWRVEEEEEGVELEKELSSDAQALEKYDFELLEKVQ